MKAARINPTSVSLSLYRVCSREFPSFNLNSNKKKRLFIISCENWYIKKSMRSSI